ncbi:MAG: hypothetical protein A2508_09025 [Candidatus Lambdaproteobacteria bacterium RIFOXYD12_FULL_49_8]|uniref:Polyamine aminopropyltransferase n=1 Tax=Candidatus Lambdaproteobacteria bacterium RIFOXYD2_FULL_50_16 TaxID=1817772 RepID=A0A1F6GAQ1_9PROT|nr:MAG: hypothetical protein A2527_08355 [Candidatus Lambdaproteobacteria bacterium RIFOXYD2_FULL_50_16]OGG97940.1 MAG: hypothetical protein A2508_09025 [Candidatus Lambdaproteobacteria bacterium RIFOXYD12_FULL_49_8]
MRQVIHVIAEYIRCRNSRHLFTDQKALLEVLKLKVKLAGLEIVAEAGYGFGDGGGVTASVVLAESHLNIHTWPERDFYLNLDISVCNYEQDNTNKALVLAQSLKDLFEPLDVNEKIIKGYRDFEDDKYTEYFSKDYGFFIKPEAILYKSEDSLQEVEVYHTKDFGRLLRIDKFYQTSEEDEHFYHEPLVQPAMTAHERPEQVLIIGAGDGGVLANVLKHNTVKRAVMVEIDDRVIEVSKRFLPAVHQGAFKDPRTELIIGDGFKYLAQTKERFDVIILDLTDPIGPARSLYTKEFYETVKGAMKGPESILSLHTVYPFFHPAVFGRIGVTLASVFGQVAHGLQFVPLYGAEMGFAFCSAQTQVDHQSVDLIEQRLKDRGVTGLKLYNGRTHQGLTAQPPFVANLLAGDFQVITKESGIDEFDQTYNVARN